MGKVDGRTKVCGLIANPIEHTLSPILHNTLADLLNQNLIYIPFKPEKGQVNDAVKGAYALDVLGLNVSVPYKQDVMESLVAIDEGAKKIGAVNTLVRTEGGYKGYNTDYFGLLRAFRSENISLKGQNVILLGAGGASKAVSYLCCKEEVKKVYLLNRTIEKAEEIASEMNEYFGNAYIEPMKLEEYDKIPYKKKEYLAIQTTSVGMFPHTTQAIIEQKEFYERLHTAFDIIYTPSQTTFMRLAKESGAKVYNGLKMLLYQGIIAYELWNQIEVSEEIASYIYKVMEKELAG